MPQKIENIRFGVLMAVIMKNVVFRDLRPCTAADEHNYLSGCSTSIFFNRKYSVNMDALSGSKLL